MRHPAILLLVDLDGTITSSAINNTYDFIEVFYRVYGMYKRLSLLHFLLRNASFIKSLISFLKIGKIISIDGVLISILLLGIEREKIEQFSYLWSKALYKARLFNADVILLIELAKKISDIKLVMFTSCSEVPACVIARLLGFHNCIARRLNVLKGLIICAKDLGDIPTFKYSMMVKLLNEFKNECKKVYIADLKSVTAELRLITSGFFDLLLIYDEKHNMLRYVEMAEIKGKNA